MRNSFHNRGFKEDCSRPKQKQLINSKCRLFTVNTVCLKFPEICIAEIKLYTKGFFYWKGGNYFDIFSLYRNICTALTI